MALFGKNNKKEVPTTTLDDPFGTPSGPQQPAPAELPPAPMPKIKVRADAYTLLLGLSALATGVAAALLSGAARYVMDSLFGG